MRLHICSSREVVNKYDRFLFQCRLKALLRTSTAQTQTHIHNICLVEFDGGGDSENDGNKRAKTRLIPLPSIGIC